MCMCLSLLSLTELRWLHALLKEAKPSYKFFLLHEEGPSLSPAAYSLWDLLTCRLLQDREWPNLPSMHIFSSNSPQAKLNTNWMFLLLTGQWAPHLKMPVWCWQRSPDFQSLMFVLISHCSSDCQHIKEKSNLSSSQVCVTLHPRGSFPHQLSAILSQILQVKVFLKEKSHVKLFKIFFLSHLFSFFPSTLYFGLLNTDA